MGKKFKITVDGETFEVEVEEIKSKQTITKINKVSEELVSSVEREPEVKETKKETASTKNVMSKPTSSTVANQTKTSKGVVTAPLPGEILSINVKKGNSVKKGDQLLVIEAMKMENEVFASTGGTIKEIFVKPGDYVETGQKLIEIGE